jgi:LuxR family transcriptional regulator, quorum-sensing system regulator LasR
MVETSHLVRLLDIEDRTEWSQTLSTLAAELGFDQVLCGIATSRPRSLEDIFIGGNYSSEWMSYYNANGLLAIDPIVRHCGSSNLPVVWRPQTFAGVAERAMYEEASSHGIRSGISLPVHGPKGEAGVISFTRDAPPDAAFEREVAKAAPVLALLRDYVFASSQKFFSRNEHSEPAPRLTRRELEMLQWVMAGKSSWEIARITNCSEATVNFHMANVRQKFNVNTRQQAVVKAITLGMLTPEDRHRSVSR